MGGDARPWIEAARSWRPLAALGPLDLLVVVGHTRWSPWLGLPSWLGFDGLPVKLPAVQRFQAFMTAPVRQPGDDGGNKAYGIDWLKVLCRKDRAYPLEVVRAMDRFVALLEYYRTAPGTARSSCFSSRARSRS